MSDFILSKLTELSNNGRSTGIKHGTIKRMVSELLRNDRLVKIEVKEIRYTQAQLANKLSISVEELKNYMTSTTSSDYKRGTRGNNQDIGMEILKLYCKTKFST